MADPHEAASAILSLVQIERPTVRQRVGALLVAEFLLHANRFFRGS